MAEHCCFLINKDTKKKAEWDVRFGITPEIIKSAFRGATGFILQCDGVFIPIRSISASAALHPQYPSETPLSWKLENLISFLL
jgi:hypothetical protein